jgi:hypothetical protein
LEPVAKSIGSHPERKSYLVRRTIEDWFKGSLKLIKYELPFIFRGVYSNPYSYTPGAVPYFDPFLAFFTVLLVFQVIHIWRKRNSKSLIWILFLLVLNLGPLILVHTENRYTLFVFFIPILYVFGIFRNSKKINQF